MTEGGELTMGGGIDVEIAVPLRAIIFVVINLGYENRGNQSRSA